jgi:hypothetical protein
VLALKRCDVSESEKPTEIEKVPCGVCLKEIPRSEAKIEEASDYVLYFCGLDCYEKWREENNKE